MKVKVIQSSLTLCHPVDYTVYEILQARILEWVAFPFLGGFSQHKGWNSGLHCRQILCQLRHQGRPRTPECVVYSFSSGSAQSGNRTGVSCIAGGFFTS